ncbi:MAG: AraC family transcriptional regulator [Leucobacter sp.]
MGAKTGSFAAHDLREWGRLSSSAFVPLRLHSARDSFEGRMRALTSPTAELFWISSDALTVERARLGANAYDGHDLLLMFQTGGTGAVTQHGRTVELCANSAALYDPRAPYLLEFPVDEHELIIVKVDRRRLQLEPEEVRELAAVELKHDLPGAASLLGFASGAVLDELLLTNLAADLVVSLVRTMLGASGSPRSGMLDDLKEYARLRIADVDLDVEQIARAHFVSPRRVFQAFEEVGDTPAAWVRRERMLRAQQLLGDASLSVAAVSDAVGYANPTSFSRAFARETGATPSEYRAAGAQH